jgi:hypothetical protein
MRTHRDFFTANHTHAEGLDAAQRQQLVNAILAPDSDGVDAKLTKLILRSGPNAQKTAHAFVSAADRTAPTLGHRWFAGVTAAIALVAVFNFSGTLGRHADGVVSVATPVSAADDRFGATGSFEGVAFNAPDQSLPMPDRFGGGGFEAIP